MDEKKITLAIIIVSTGLVFLLCDFVFADVVGSQHDMYFMGKGTNQNVCSYCHIPHNAFGDKIWSDWGNEAQLTSGPSTIMGNMCYTCHDNTATDIGMLTVFNTSLQQHTISSGEDCDMCHTVHDNTNEKFMNVARKQDSYCAACHDGIVNAGGLGDFTAAGNHTSYWTSPPEHNTGASCSACHFSHQTDKYKGCNLCHEKAHGAVNYSTADVANPILRIDNTDSAFCAYCHPVNTQSSTDGTKHPANLTSAGTWGKVDCETCHDPHQPDKPNNPFVLQDQNVDSAYCMYCHDATDETNGPKIGSGHPVNVPFSMMTTPNDPAKSPAGNTIDDDDIDGIDYPANSSDMICETCHSTHRKGEASPLLRITTSGSALCLNCHNM